MKMRTACLAAVPALALMFCTQRTPEGPLAPSVATDASMSAVPSAATSATKASIGPARFPHEKHFEELEIECVTCHHETNAKPLVFPHPRLLDDFWVDCSTCHRAKGEPPLEAQACSACHHSENGASGDETLSAKVVIHKSCWSCHEVGTGAAASVSCKGCHTPGS